MSRWLVRLAVLLALWLYLRSPLDLLPEWLGWPGLLDDLAVVVLALLWLRRRSGPRPSARARARGPGVGAAPGADDERPWDPFAVLGIARGASAEEIQRAYREQMRLYHPDRVAGLGPDLRELAHRKTLEIRRAYDELRAARAGAGRFR